LNEYNSGTIGRKGVKLGILTKMSLPFMKMKFLKNLGAKFEICLSRHVQIQTARENHDVRSIRHSRKPKRAKRSCADTQSVIVDR
jgi:hypothetical protein